MPFDMKKTHKNDFEKKVKKNCWSHSALVPLGAEWYPPFLKTWKNSFSWDVSFKQLFFVIVVYLCSFAENDLKILFVDPPISAGGPKTGRRVVPTPQKRRNEKCKHIFLILKNELQFFLLYYVIKT